VARTVVFEEIFREPREWCKHKSQTCDSIVKRKFFYLFTCEYCFSHYVTIFFIALTGYKLLYPEWWRGYPIAFFALVFVANGYMNLYARLRVDITSEKKAIEVKEKEAQAVQKEIEAKELEIRKMDAELSSNANGGPHPPRVARPPHSQGSGRCVWSLAAGPARVSCVPHRDGQARARNLAAAARRAVRRRGDRFLDVLWACSTNPRSWRRSPTDGGATRALGPAHDRALPRATARAPSATSRSSSGCSSTLRSGRTTS
jgi:hypothetical protein